MSDLSFVTERAGSRSLAEIRQLAARAKVPYSTVLKVVRGYTKNPKTATVESLAAALRRERRK